MYETDEIKQAVKIIFESFEESEITKKHLDELVKSTGIIDTCVTEENKVLLPLTSAVDLETVPPELVGTFNLIFYKSAEDAVFKALGVE